MKPALTLTHLKTSKQYEAGQTINRYWFQWSDRLDLGRLTVRLTLLDAEGRPLLTRSELLPKVVITKYLDAMQPVYDSPVWFYVDDSTDNRPVSFSYLTVSGFDKKSETVLAPMDGKKEDLSTYP